MLTIIMTVYRTKKDDIMDRCDWVWHIIISINDIDVIPQVEEVPHFDEDLLTDKFHKQWVKLALLIILINFPFW
jgi:hypothetical protein